MGAARALTDLRWLAYMLATVRGECGPQMPPVEEIGHGAAHAYGKPDPETKQRYFGRGYVQLTWKRNYEAMAKIVSLDLVKHPELALMPAVAVKIMFKSMIRGTFTGKKLATYFNTKTDDPLNARKIINGTDKAATFAAWHRDFLAALKKAGASLQ